MTRIGTALGILAVLVTAARPVGARPVRHTFGTVLVSPPLAAPWSGSPHGAFGVTVASSTLTTLLDEDAAPSGGPAPWVARTNLELALRIRFGGIAEIRLPLELAFPAAAQEPHDSGLPTPGPLAGGAGGGIALSPELGGGFYLGFLFELLLAWVPNDVVQICSSGCVPGTFARSTGTDLTVLLRGGALFGWATGSWRVFAGISFRNQPSGIDSSLDEESSAGGHVPFGTGFATFTAGAEVGLLDGLAIFVGIHQPVAFDAAAPQHGPILTGGIDGWIPDA